MDNIGKRIVTLFKAGGIHCTKKAIRLFGFVQRQVGKVKNYPDLDDFATGTSMVVLNPVKMRLSYRDLILLIGILVALIIGVTTLMYQERTGFGRQTSAPGKSSMNSSPAVIAKKLLQKATYPAFQF